MGTIQASHYNALQGAVAGVLGQGSGSYATNPITDSNQLYGYGQSVASTSVTQNSNITAAQWHALREDILKCYYHQGLMLQLPSIPANTSELTTVDYNLYIDLITAITLPANRLAFPAAGQYTGTLLTAPTKSNFVGTVIHTATVDFGSYTDGNSNLVTAESCARYFFNAGGRIEITPTIAGGGISSPNGSTSLDLAWKSLFTRVGSVYLNYNSTECTNTNYTSGPGQTVYVSSNIGFNSLTTTYQTIIISTSGAYGGTYYPNEYRINAKVNKTPDPTQIIFQIVFDDTSTHANEAVDSTITSTIAYTRASGSNVSVVGPSVINSSFV